MTTDVQVAEMRDFAEYIQSNSYIKEAIVDDWGLYGNFSIIITPHTHEKTSTNKQHQLANQNPAVRVATLYGIGVRPATATGPRDYLSIIG